jgi:hypothetical protein
MYRETSTATRTVIARFPVHSEITHWLNHLPHLSVPQGAPEACKAAVCDGGDGANVRGVSVWEREKGCGCERGAGYGAGYSSPWRRVYTERSVLYQRACCGEDVVYDVVPN